MQKNIDQVVCVIRSTIPFDMIINSEESYVRFEEAMVSNSEEPVRKPCCRKSRPKIIPSQIGV